MKEQDAVHSNFNNDESNLQFDINKEYYNFFDYAPVALYIEDFSKVKKFIEEKANEANLCLESYLSQNQQIIENDKIQSMFNFQALKFTNITTKNS